MNQPLPSFVTEGPVGFTAAEFLRMAEGGAFDDFKVELIAGEIQRMNPPMGGHSSRQAMVIGLLWASVPDAAGRLHGEVGVRLDDDTVVACDAALLRTPVTERRALEAAELLLAVKVAETTADRDLGLKRRLYAAAGVPNYWVLDGARGVTHVFGSPADGDYATVAVVPFGEPLAVPGTDAAIRL